MRSERFYDANTAPSNRKWFGEGDQLSFMFEVRSIYLSGTRCVSPITSPYNTNTAVAVSNPTQCSDVSFGDRRTPIGVAPWVDVNATSLSFWCFDISAADAAYNDPSSKDAGDDVVPQHTSQHSAGISSGPFSDPILVQIPLSNVGNISYSKSSRNCIMTIDRRGFMESYLPKLVPFSKVSLCDRFCT